MPIAVAIVFAVADVRRAAAAGADTAPPPDIVRTRDGGVLRGTIIESVPNERIEIMLPNGQSRTVMMAAVEFAGPAHRDPQAVAAPVAPLPTPVREMARLELEADRPGVTFHRHVGSSQGYVRRSGRVVLDNFEQLCTAPCTAEVPAGTHRLAVSTRGSKRVLPTPKEMVLNGDMAVDARIKSNAGVRATGVVLMLASLVGGLAIAAHSQQQCYSSSCVNTYPHRGAGTAVGVLGMLVGLVLSGTPDQASISAR
jgi:hypothetical protein